MRHEPHLVIAVALAGMGLLLTLIVALSATPLAGEDALARQVQRLPGSATPIAEALRAVTGTTAVMGLTTAMAVLITLAGQRWRAFCLAVALAVLVLGQASLKDIVDRPRPSDAYVEVRDGWTSPSFPSGHVMGGTFLFASFALLPAVRSAPPQLRRVATAIAVGAIAANAVANVFMGVHWPTDVAAGLLFGGSLAAAAARIARRPPVSQTR